ncbi:MAG: Rpp14/Pop5 family protein [Methanoregula sp.]|jgi:ribonuclease P/MRP protein subunit POP5
MGARPPTLREKRRYLLVSVEPSGTIIDRKDLYYAVCDATTSLWGDMTAAIIKPAIIMSEGQFVIIRCRRGTERELSIALSTITCCRDKPIALRIVAASGTIDTLREKIHRLQDPDTEPASQHEYMFGEKLFQIHYCHGQKVDVIEKGFKNTNRLFLTKEDLEEL